MIDFGRVTSFNKPIMMRLYVTRSRVIMIRVQCKNLMNESFITKVSFSIDAGFAYFHGREIRYELDETYLKQNTNNVLVNGYLRLSVMYCISSVSTIRVNSGISYLVRYFLKK